MVWIRKIGNYGLLGEFMSDIVGSSLAKKNEEIEKLKKENSLLNKEVERLKRELGKERSIHCPHCTSDIIVGLTPNHFDSYSAYFRLKEEREPVKWCPNCERGYKKIDKNKYLIYNNDRKPDFIKEFW